MKWGPPPTPLPSSPKSKNIIFVLRVLCSREGCGGIIHCNVSFFYPILLSWRYIFLVEFVSVSINRLGELYKTCTLSIVFLIDFLWLIEGFVFYQS